MKKLFAPKGKARYLGAMTTNQYLIGGLITLAVVVGAVLLLRPQPNSPAPAAQATSSLSTTSSANGGAYTVREVSPQQYQTNLETSLAQASAASGKGDYAGAERILLAASAQWPSDETVRNNLADLYLRYLKNYQKAAQEYRAVVKLDPRNVNAYTMLFAIYSEKLYVPSANAAADILREGIAANPKAVNLEVQLAEYYRSQGQTAAANAEFDAAIENAQSQGLTSLVTQIEADKSGQ